jgi:hypothetical protein
MLTIRFRNFPDKKIYPHFSELIELSTGEKTYIIEDINKNVDLEITGPYGDINENYKTPLMKKLKRYGYIKFTNGGHLKRKELAVGIQPRKTAKKNIWFTGENQRPPQGKWDGYLSFDTNLPDDRCVYFPLWFITSTSLFESTKKSYWDGNVPSISELTDGRDFTKQKRLFASSFIGKSYAMRLHALEELAKIGKVDVFGESVRRKVQSPAKIANRYRFVMCFENDIYPGYVTEKPIEAYLSGAIPLYYGLDTSGFLNSSATINLVDFNSISEWGKRIVQVESNLKFYKEIYEKPILLKKPTLKDATKLISRILNY